MLNIAEQAARKAGHIILRALDRLDTITVSQKSTNDFVTEIDNRAEQTLIYHIHKAYPNHGILAEESGEQASETNDDITWIIDPLDGTTNFIHGIPHFAISIAIAERGRVTHGLIYDPVRDECFTATRGRGAQLNRHRLRVSSCTKMEAALLATGLPFRNRHLYQEYHQTLNTLWQQSSDIRRMGSAALDLAYVAAGRYDGYWEYALHAWDIAAGALLVKEAGGYVTDFAGGDDYLDHGNIIAATPKVYTAIYQAIAAVNKN